MSLKDKDLISIHDLSVGEVATILDVAKKLKRKQKAGEPHQYLKGKTLAMLFSKASTRTRTSFEVGFWQLGGHPIYLSDSASRSAVASLSVIPRVYFPASLTVL